MIFKTINFPTRTSSKRTLEEDCDSVKRLRKSFEAKTSSYSEQLYPLIIMSYRLYPANDELISLVDIGYRPPRLPATRSCKPKFSATFTYTGTNKQNCYRWHSGVGRKERSSRFELFQWIQSLCDEWEVLPTPGNPRLESGWPGEIWGRRSFLHKAFHNKLTWAKKEYIARGREKKVQGWPTQRFCETLTSAYDNRSPNIYPWRSNN